MQLSLKVQRQLVKEAKSAAKKYMHRPDIRDVQFGFKNVKGESIEQLSIRFLVEKKQPEKTLHGSERIPKMIGQFYTDVVDHSVAPQLLRRVDPHDRITPLFGGLEIQSSLYNQRTHWGTLACIVYLRGRPLGLTNFHVAFGNLTASQVGERLETLRIFQPNRPNGGIIIGRPTGLFHSGFDYAFFEIAGDVDEAQSLNNIPGTLSDAVYPRVGAVVGKTGAATGFTLGKIDALSMVDPSQIAIRYEPSNANESPIISDYGDSGSLWAVGDQKQVYPVALHHGGDRQQNVAYATAFLSILKSIQNKH